MLVGHLDIAGPPWKGGRVMCVCVLVRVSGGVCVLEMCLSSRRVGMLIKM